MNHEPSNQSLTILKTHLMSALNGCKIKRYEYDENGRRGAVVQKIGVPLRYGHKTRQIHESQQINGAITLPVIAVSFNGLTLNSNRNEGKTQELYDFTYTGEDGIIKYCKPTPVDVSFTMTIVTSKGSDMEEILEHYISVFNPYIYISSKHPFTNKEVRSKVIWDGSASPQWPNNVPSNDKIRYTTSLGFTVEGWIYREKPQRGGAIIKQIDYNLAYQQFLECGIDDATYIPDDSFSLSGMPTFLDISPNCVNVGDSVLIDGENLEHLDGVFFCAASGFEIPTTSWNPFCLSESLSAQYPAFDAYVLEEWQTIDDNRIIITIPDELSASNVEVGFVNRYCGILKSTDVLTGDCDNPIIEIT